MPYIVKAKELPLSCSALVLCWFLYRSWVAVFNEVLLNAQSMFYIVGCYRAGSTSITSTGMPYRYLKDIVSTVLPTWFERYINLISPFVHHSSIRRLCMIERIESDWANMPYTRYRGSMGGVIRVWCHDLRVDPPQNVQGTRYSQPSWPFGFDILDVPGWYVFSCWRMSICTQCL